MKLIIIIVIMTIVIIENSSKLLQHLVQLQKNMEASDVKFAKMLGITQAMWTFTKQGRRKIGLSILMGITKKFPELQPEVIDFLKE